MTVTAEVEEPTVSFFTSKHPAIEIPVVPFHQFITSAISRQDPQSPAVIDSTDGRVITHGQLKDNIIRLAIGLDALGLEKNEVFAIIAPNFPEFATVFHVQLSCCSLLTFKPGRASCRWHQHHNQSRLLTTGNATSVEPDNSTSPTDGARVASYFAKCCPTYFTPDKVLQVRRHTPTVNKVVVYCKEKPTDLPLDCVWFYDLLQNESNPDLLPKVRFDPKKDLALLPFTASPTGTLEPEDILRKSLGLPKGVMLSHYNLVANICQLETCENLSEKDVLIGALPLYDVC